MSDIQLYLFEADKNKKEATRIAVQTSKRLESKELKLLQLIESLGEYLNNDEAAIRTKTMSYLAEVLAAVPSKVLSRQHSTFLILSLSNTGKQLVEKSTMRLGSSLTLRSGDLLCDFILSRVADDREAVAPHAKALLALEERGKWDAERVASVTTTLLDHTHPLRQYKLQSERYPVLQLTDLLMAKYREALETLHNNSPDFMHRFVSYFDGEKDPRNLMIVYSILRVPMTEWNISSDAQDLFDAVFNYFPITFRPPPDDPYGITAQDLKDRLRSCIAATAEFAPYAFPALLDKLDSTSMNTKRDVLHTITDCVANYGPRTVALYSVTLWDALKYEILNVQEEDLAEGALKALAEIARQLSPGSDDALNAYLRPVVKESNEHLEDAPTKQSQATGRILHAIVQASPQASNFVLAAVLPNIFTLYQTADTIAKRRGLLEVLVQLLRANSSVYGEWRAIGQSIFVLNGTKVTDPNALAKFSGRALETMSNAVTTVPLKEVSFRLVALDGLLQLVRIRGLLHDDEASSIIKVFYDVVIKEDSYGRDEMKTAAIQGLVDVAHQKPQLVVDKAFPAFMAELPDTDTDSSAAYIPVLEAFAKLSSEDKIFDTVVLRLRNKLNTAVHQGASSTYIQAILTAILYAFSHGAVSLGGTEDHCPYYDDVFLPLLTQISDRHSPSRYVLHDELTLDLVGRVCNLILRRQTTEFQRKFCEVLPRYIPNPEKIPPRATDESLRDTRTMVLHTHLLAALRRDVQQEQDHDALLKNLIALSTLPELSVKIRSAILSQISLVVNKGIPTSSLKPIVSPLLEPPKGLLSPDTLNQLNIRVVFAITRALVLRNASLTNALLPTLLTLLSNSDHGTTIARGFTTLLQPDDILTKENHCVISGLHQQKAFHLLVPPLAASFATQASHTKTNGLIALSGILRGLPYSIVEPELPALTPLLLQSLDAPAEHDVRASAIDTLTAVLTHSPKPLEEHVGSLIARLLGAATTEKGAGAAASPARIRVKALVCLALVPARLRGEVVMPYRRQVVKRLTGALDDGRRAVRSEAVKCRAKWMELGEVDDDVGEE